MPQINRIRVNNVKYNFGTQFYDDFMMRFSCKNTIYDLANGGGKSLLMLLLLQNVIPNCTLDEKQPIEKLFRGKTDNTAIHSLVEWALDPCYQKDNFRYMTTGFCARKARGSAQEEENDSPDMVQGSGSASIEYFNYVIFYRQFGDNDIKNLPLSENGRRVTYQELKDYLKNLEKKDLGVQVRIFDRKGDYQSFISRYGLYESAWEIIRGINKTEGHVRTYFENNYRTSRKVVEDLLIEEIIQKSFHNRAGVNNAEASMAQTLLDIKDKLLELSAKHRQMGQYDAQVQSIGQFAVQLEDFLSIYANKAEKQRQLAGMYQGAERRLQQLGKDLEQTEKTIGKIDTELDRERRFVDTAEIMEQEASLRSLKELVDESAADKAGILAQTEKLRAELTRKECAFDYKDYIECKKQLQEIDDIIQNRLRDKKDILNELGGLAAARRQSDEERKVQVRKELEETGQFAQHEEKSLAHAKAEAKDNNGRAAFAQGKSESIKKAMAQCEKQLADELTASQTLVLSDALQELSGIEQEIENAENTTKRLADERDKCAVRLAQCRLEIGKADAGLEIQHMQLAQLNMDIAEENEAEEALCNLKKVYGEQNVDALVKATGQALNNITQSISELENKINYTAVYIEAVRRGRFECDGEQYGKVYDYLLRQYGEDVVTGADWYAGLNQGQKRDIYKRVPFIHYGFIIKGEFERVKADTGLQQFYGSSYAVPVISENVLYDTKLEVNSELITFASKDLSFLTDMGQVQTEIKRCTEEISEWEERLARLHDNREVIQSDYDCALRASVKNDLHMEFRKRSEAVQAECEKLKLEKETLSQREQDLSAKHKNLQEQWKEAADALDILKKRRVALTEIRLLGETLDSYDIEYNETIRAREEAKGKAKQAEDNIEPSVRRLEVYRKKEAALTEELVQMEREWQNYSPYYKEDAAAAGTDCSREELESRFAALRSLVEEDAKDLTDKEKLRAHLSVSMGKYKAAVEYKGETLESIRKAIENHEVSYEDANERHSMKQQLEQLNVTLREVEKRLESQSALYNRLDGSIAHGIHQIEEKYGIYEEFECANPDLFKAQHKTLIQKMDDNRKHLLEKAKLLQKELAQITVMHKDMERLFRSCGMKDYDAQEAEEDFVRSDFTQYEAVQAELEQLRRSELRRRDAFEKKKKELIAALTGLHAAELAQEFEKSLQAPENVQECMQLQEQLKETNAFIILEKDRIGQSIEDMERIKDSFENRCIQICSNIKAELNRLPKLSTITMEEETISVVRLQIPFVKEESIKGRMSAYIDETVTAAESFADAGERLRYIRNRLAWKRLFSVIVTDMESVRVSLYKRERIKDQSRYLRYEEAVGSTGQSQGIYIQFLIAIINYIANTNAPASQAPSVGKTIFIDNPFGAAKDIYIWEPIFKLLSANHVQLIVPARGATPAIMGRFDVNYILGQKLSDQRQQTVVIDYRSSVDNDIMEYEKLEFEQQSLELLYK